MEQLQREGKYGQLYGKIRQLTKGSSKCSVVVKDTDGSLLTDEDSVTRRWKECSEDLYGRSNRPTEKEIEKLNGSISEEDDLGPSLMKEVLTMLKELKNGNSEGVMIFWEK